MQEIARYDTKAPFACKKRHEAELSAKHAETYTGVLLMTETRYETLPQKPEL
jgi:hypothetical protein